MRGTRDDAARVIGRMENIFEGGERREGCGGFDGTAVVIIDDDMDAETLIHYLGKD